jgi:membrane protease YdiL (CAAX protease family)
MTGSGEPDEVRLRRTRIEEVLVVLSLSILYSAVTAIISLSTAPVHGIAVSAVPTAPLFAYQLTDFVFGLAPVWLVIHLLGRTGEGPGSIGLRWDGVPDVVWGVALAAIVGGVGLGLYRLAVALQVNRFVIPVAPGHWWTVPVLVMTSIQAGLLEEVVAAYLITRLGQIGLSAALSVGLAAILRGAYHLYQGWGGFAGNLLLGIFFGTILIRTRRTWPFVLAHATVDLAAGLLYLHFRNRLSWI